LSYLRAVEEQKNAIMKFILAFLFLGFVSVSNAAETTVSTTETAKMEQNDGRKKAKRVNKKRKRKCSQFGRQIYAG
jgi:hypothetical protein